MTQLCQQLRELGVQAGSSILIHASMKSLGPIGGDAQTVVEAILEAVGPSGTALFPTHTWAKLAPFDVIETASVAVGVIPEVARHWPGAVRSLHPTHSVVAIGPSAGRLTEGHYFSPTPCGYESPYHRLAETGGSVLLLGVNHERNTSLHLAEELAGIEGAVREDYVVCRVRGYDRIWKQRPTRLHLNTKRSLMRIDDSLEEKGIQRRGLVGEAECRLTDAGSQLWTTVSVLQGDPRFFF
jgi:aminoglycoside 3-N-acetyltransferase